MLSSWTSWFNKTSLFYYRSSLFLARKLIELVYFLVQAINPAPTSMMPIPHPRRRRLDGGGLLDQRGHVRDWAPPGWYGRCYLPGGVGWWGASPSLTRSLFGGGRMGQWWCRGFRTPRRWYVTVSARRTSTSVATWLRWRAGSTIPGRFFKDLTGAMILCWFLLFGCPPPAPIPVGRYGSSCTSDAICMIVFEVY